MANMNTGDVSKALGFLITRKDIEAMGVVPAEVIKGYPRWKASDLKAIAAGIILRMEAIIAGKIPPGAAAAAVAEDDDEL